MHAVTLKACANLQLSLCFESVANCVLLVGLAGKVRNAAPAVSPAVERPKWVQAAGLLRGHPRPRAQPACLPNYDPKWAGQRERGGLAQQPHQLLQQDEDLRPGKLLNLIVPCAHALDAKLKCFIVKAVAEYV
jgi:hypothetical protein